MNVCQKLAYRSIFRPLGCLLLAALFLALDQHYSDAAGPRVLAAGKLPADRRLEPLKDLDGYFPFAPPASTEAWERRSEQLRRQMLVSLGLWPMPTKTPLNAVVHGRVDRGDYTVEKVYFESLPGFFVTGNLYRPKGQEGKLPGVLCPHGHWANGRFYDTGLGSVRDEIKQGAEKFEEGGRSPLQARCVQLARMGCVVFHYDMIGYADSTQLSFELAHRFAKQRPEMNTRENWGLFSTQAETHVQSVMGLQAYDSIRALDFLTSLPDVDPQRLAVTGASGGGTQTMILAAIDPRPAVAFPAVMVSTAMQGGCTCENCSGLRVETGNVEFAALFAPKPLGMTAADDWTKELKTKGFPQLQEHYRRLGAPDKVMLLSRTEFGHNYNAVSRAAMYQWFNQHLGLNADPEERDYQRLSRDQMTVWDAEHPRPVGGDDFERQLLRWWTDDAQQQLAALKPTDASSLRRYREVVGGATDALIGRNLPAAADVEFEQLDKSDEGDYLTISGLLRNKPQGEELPIVFLHPKPWDGMAVIWIDRQGKAGMYSGDGSLKPEISQLLAAGVSVVGVDLLYQGEFLTDGKPLTKTRRVPNPREFAGYTFGYNRPVFAQRVHDILSVVSFVRNHEYTPKQVALVGLRGVGPLVAAARAQAGNAIDLAAIDTGGFRFASLTDFQDVDYLTGGAKYYDLPGILSLSAPDKLWLAGEGKSAPETILAAYRAAGAEENLTVFSDNSEVASAAVNWLLQQP